MARLDEGGGDVYREEVFDSGSGLSYQLAFVWTVPPDQGRVAETDLKAREDLLCCSTLFTERALDRPQFLANPDGDPSVKDRRFSGPTSKDRFDLSGRCRNYWTSSFTIRREGTCGVEVGRMGIVGIRVGGVARLD
jgi:hypothetical protein